jgi:large subunit ribosomal protein L10
MQIAKKHEVVADLSERLGEAKCLYLTDFTGLDVASITELRRRLSAAHVEYLVVKNTLARRALAGSPYEGLTEHLSGPNAFALSRDDVVTAAKILTEFARERERPRIRAGAIEGRVVSIEEIRRIADLPPRDQLLAQVVGYARAPIAGLVYTLSGLLAKFVRTVDAVREQKEASGESAGAQAPDTVVAEEPAASAGESSES